MNPFTLLVGSVLALIVLSACATAEPAKTAAPTLTLTPTKSSTDAVTSTPAQDCTKGYVALTFDDGPFAGQTDQLIATLDATGLKATFFNLGQHVAGNEALVRAELEHGWVGNHSWDHKDMTTITQDEIKSELADTQKALQNVTGQAPVLFRPPYLKTNGTLKDVEVELGLVEIMTIIDSKDWAGVSAEEIVANVSAARPGDVVLLHDNLTTTRAALPKIAEFLKSQKLCAGMIDPKTRRAVAP